MTAPSIGGRITARIAALEARAASLKASMVAPIARVAALER